MGLPCEEFLLPIQKFNDIVGPLFAALHGRFPLDDHKESGLQRSLGVFLNFAFQTAVSQLEKIRPEPLSREDWSRATPEIKATHLKWQSNLRYLKQRNLYFMKMLAPSILREPIDDSF